MTAMQVLGLTGGELVVQRACLPFLTQLLDKVYFFSSETSAVCNAYRLRKAYFVQAGVSAPTRYP